MKSDARNGDAECRCLGPRAVVSWVVLLVVFCIGGGSVGLGALWREQSG